MNPLIEYPGQRFVRYNASRGTIDLKQNRDIIHLSVENFTGLVGRDIALAVVAEPNRWIEA